MDLQLHDEVYVVTGGSSGIGRALVSELVAAGARVSTCARDADRLEQLHETVSGPGTLHTARCDVTDPHQVQAYFAEVLDTFDRIDGLVNNAGQSRMSDWNNTEFADWMAEVELKFGGVIHTTKAAEAGLARSKNPSIVNINAVLARQPETRLVATSAARAGVLNLTKSLSIELAPAGIRVNSVCLGLIDSGQWTRRYEQAATGQSYDEWCADLAADRGIALRRLGRPEEVAFIVASLLSRRSSYVTGTTIDVAGGVGRYV